MIDAEAMSDERIIYIVHNWPESETGDLSAGDPVWAGIATLDDGSAVGMECNTYGQKACYRFSDTDSAEEWLDAIADSLV